MAKNRYFPFGYGMVNGELVVLDAEAETVRQIFQAYSHGSSYQAIASQLSDGPVPYRHEEPIWNKHMVKRILENNEYTGGGKYPKIVDPDIFHQVAHIRESRGWESALPATCLKALRSRVLCAKCGAKMKRISKSVPAVWKCQNDDCGITGPDDAKLLDILTRLLNTLIKNPVLVDITLVDITIQSTDLMRMNNEIGRQIDSRGCDEELAISLILAAAGEKYALCDDGGLADAAVGLREHFSSAKPLDTFDASLFSDTVMSAMLGVNGLVQVKLNNEQVFGPAS